MFKIERNYTYNREKYGGYSSEISSLVPPGTQVLDIGCSTGALARILTGNKGCQVIGVDIDENSLKEASRYCDKVLQCDLDDLAKLNAILAGELFDVITLGDVLEHLKYPGILLRTLKRYLKNGGGIVIASLPNAAFIPLRIKFLFGDFSYDKRGGLMDEDHLRFFSFKTAKLLFEDAGYRVKKLYGVSIVRKKFWFLKPLAKLFPSLFAIHIIISAQNEAQK
jgi:SAM-dependent methyltransferase